MHLILFRLSTRVAIFAVALLPLLEYSCSNSFVNVLAIVYIVVWGWFWSLCVGDCLRRKTLILCGCRSPQHPRTVVVFPFQMSSLFSNFRQWRKNVTRPQNENQLGSARRSQSGNLLCLCWLTGSLTADFLCHGFLSCTCDVQVMENIHTTHALFF